jgi:hypothetical protein
MKEKHKKICFALVALHTKTVAKGACEGEGERKYGQEGAEGRTDLVRKD